MGDGAAARRQPAARGVRARGAACVTGDDDARPLPVATRRSVVLYGAAGCHLCERARRVVLAVREDIDFDLREVDITGDPELEARHREWLPVVEIDGRRAFVYHVDQTALRRKLAAQTPG